MKKWSFKEIRNCLIKFKDWCCVFIIELSKQIKPNIMCTFSEKNEMTIIGVVECIIQGWIILLHGPQNENFGLLGSSLRILS